MSTDFVPSDRAHHQTTECFALYTDVAKQMFAEVYEKNPSLLDIKDINARHARELIETYPAEAELFWMSQDLISLLPRRSEHDGRFDRHYHVTSHDKDEAARFDTFAFGFGDPDFAWHFSPAVAAAVVHQFEAEGIITSEEHRSMTLRDWANIIGTGWFSDLMHSLAFTANGIYGTLGKDMADFAPGAFAKRLGIYDIKIDTLFDLSQQAEPETGEVYWTAKATKELKKALRHKIEDKSRSAGCPVARLGTRLPEVLLDEDFHVEHLIKMGELALGDDANPNDEYVRVEQEYTAIDEALMIFADLLDRYEVQHGTPVVNDISRPGASMFSDKFELKHYRLPSSISGKIISQLQA